MATAKFWSDRTLEPKRKAKFILRLGGSIISEYYVKKVKKPGFETTETEHKFLNHTFYFPNRLKWDEITVTIVDPVTEGDPSEALYKLMLASGYELPNKISLQTNLKTISKAGATNALQSVYIKQIDHTGKAVEEWVLHNAWVKKVEFGDLDYDSEDLTDITLTIRYDWATLEKDGFGPSAESVERNFSGRA